MADGLRRKLVCDGAQIAHSSYVGPCALHTIYQTVHYDTPFGFTASLETFDHQSHTCARMWCVRCLAASHMITFGNASASWLPIPDGFWVMWEGPPPYRAHSLRG